LAVPINVLPLPFNVLKTSRYKLMQILTQSTAAELNATPAGRKNNLYWQAGHMIVSFHLLTYARCGIALPMPESWPNLFRKGTSPADWTDLANIKKNGKISLPSAMELANLAQELIEKMEQDYKSGAFDRFEPYETSFGVVLQSFEDAFLYAHLHEGIHWGVIYGIQKEIAK